MFAPARIALLTVLSSVFVFIYGCGGGDEASPGPGGGSMGNTNGTGGAPGATAPVVSTPVFLVGQSGGSVATSVVVDGVSTVVNQANPVAVDPQNPGVGATLLAPAGQYSNEIGIEYGVYDPISKTLLGGAHIRYILFVQGNRFVKINLVKGAALAGEQVSSESSANNLCSFNRKQLVDYTNPENSAIAYSLRGADNICGASDDEWRIIRLSMGATDLPLPAKQSITGLINHAGAAIGWLAVDGNELRRYDVNFQNPTVLTTFTGTAEETTRVSAAFEQAIVRAGIFLYQYDASANTLTPLFSFVLGGNAGALIASTRDSQSAYLSVNYPALGRVIN